MRGGDTTGLRAYNERLIVNELLRAGALSKAEIARVTGLSGQAASVIVNRLIEAGLVVKRDKVRKLVGQPSTPIAANPDGAFALGVKIGRRSTEAVLVNLLGEILARREVRYAVPRPKPTMDFARRLATEVLTALAPEKRPRLVGLGIAMPGELHAWAGELGLPPDALAAWRDLDVAADLAAATKLPAELYNDAMAACAAEVIAGRAITSRSALYVYIGTFIGGGVVLDGRLYRGERLNAGAIGSIPVRPGSGRPAQLIETTSVMSLERAFAGKGLDLAPALERPSPAAEAVFDAWCGEAVGPLAQAVVSALGVIDFETVVVDGLLPPAWRERLTRRLVAEVGRFNHFGLTRAQVVPGTIGPVARVLGAALLPLWTRFSPNTDLLVQSPSAVGGTAEATAA